METTPPVVKRPRGRPRKNPLPVVEAPAKPQISILEGPIEDLPPLETAHNSPVVEPEPALNYLPPEPPIRYPNHLSPVELWDEITRYATIVGGRMKQLIDEWARRFPIRR